MATPPCTYFGNCGGCTTQHLAYETQIIQKKQALARAIKFPEENIKVFSGKEYFYRNRMDVLFSPQGIGLRKKGKVSEIIPIDRCVIADETINKLLNEARNFFTPSRIQSCKKTFSSLIIRATSIGENGLCFVLQENSLHRQEAITLIRDFTSSPYSSHYSSPFPSSFSSAKNVVVAFTSPASAFLSEETLVIKGGEFLQEKFLEKTFQFPISGFFQNNSVLADKMHDYCRKLLQQYPTQQAHLLDLYAGVGTFGILNADLFKSTILVESAPLAVKAAEFNIKNNIIPQKIPQITFHKLDAMRLRKITLPKPLFVITDPPRIGMHQQTIHYLNQAQPEIIIYISCNPQRLAKELPKFKEYVVKSAALFDFFPQTGHSEAVVQLRKK
ncbi:class I SAM-dependent RNA methyltransferase [Candidatus Woesearchaeota archaeon]|nr:class I SAM-dependent RNA methyltransferase [Candidatus Woesearchaeota archaeon]